jgi:cation:H+ antiporter
MTCASAILGLDLSTLATPLLAVLVTTAIALLAIGADRTVTGAARLASTLGVSKVIIGATVVSLGTTSAEAFVSVTAAFRGQGDLALGNAVGSIIVDTAFIFGLSCLISSIPKDRFVLHRHGLVKLTTDALLTATLFLLAWLNHGWNGVTVPRSVGVLYVLLLAAYMYLSVRWARAHPEFAAPEAGVVARITGTNSARPHKLRKAFRNLLLLSAGLALVLAGSHLLLEAVGELCTRYHVPPDIMAVTLIAFGTSLPELVTAVASIVKKHPELLVGNIIGADILNVLFVTGFSAAAVPLKVSPSFFRLHLPVMWASSLLLGAYILTGGSRFHRWQGLLLMAVYVTYCVLLLRTL